MKMQDQVNEKMELTQEKIDDLRSDLLTVLESHMDTIDSSELIYEIIKYMIIALYSLSPNHAEAFRVMKLAMEDGIKNHVSTHI